MDKFLTKDQVKTILQQAPKGSNPDTIVNGLVSRGYTLQGLNEKAPEPQKESLGSKLGERAKTAGKEVLNLATLGGASVSPEDIQEARNGQGELVALQAVNRAAQSPIRIAGAVGGAIGDVVGAGLEATGLDKPIAQAIQPIVQSDPVQKAMEVYKTLPQETQDVLGSIVNAANIPLAGGVKSVAQAGIKTGANTVGKAASKTVSKVVPTAEKATANTYKGIMDVVENKKSLLNNFKKSEGTGKDPIRVIAENPDYLVKINSEAKTIDATDAITHMKRDIEDYSGIRDNVLATADQTLPPIPTNNIIKDVSSKFSAKNYSSYLDEGEKAVKEVITKLQTLKKYNPDTVSRVSLNEIRKGIDETINSFTDTKLKDKMRADLRTVFKETLENSIPESGLLKELNAKIGDIIDASKFVETRLNGTKVKGGGLTDLAMKATGANIGAAGAGGVLGGVPGAVAGYAISDFLSKQLIKNAINNPFDRAVLEKLKQARTEVVKRAEEYIKSTSQGRTSKTEVAPKLLQQSSPNSIPKEVKSKGIRGMIDFESIIKSLIPTKKLITEAKDTVSELESAISFVKSVKSPRAIIDARKELADVMTKMGKETVITDSNYKTIIQEADDMASQLKAHIKDSESKSINDIANRGFSKK